MTDPTAMALARMIVSDALHDLHTLRPPPWQAANDPDKPKKSKDRSKVKAARKQRMKK